MIGKKYLMAAGVERWSQASTKSVNEIRSISSLQVGRYKGRGGTTVLTTNNFYARASGLRKVIGREHGGWIMDHPAHSAKLGRPLDLGPQELCLCQGGRLWCCQHATTALLLLLLCYC
jgi:hypothetical protein